MFIGHLAIALASKRAVPGVSLGVLIAAVFGLDLIWPLLLLSGVERVSVQPGATAFTPLSFESYPWSHSLAMAIVWSVLTAIALRGRGRTAALVVGAGVASHWLLDAVTHRPDLPLWPGGPEVGLGLWHSVPATIVVEGTLFVAAVMLFTRTADLGRRRARVAFWGLVGFCTAIWLSGPFSPPPPSAAAVAVVGLALWLLPLWGHWIERTATPTAASIRERLIHERRKP